MLFSLKTFHFSIVIICADCHWRGKLIISFYLLPYKIIFYLCCSLIGYSAQSNYSDSWTVWLENLKNILNKAVVSVFRGTPNYYFIRIQKHVAMAAISGSEGPRTYVWGNFQDVLSFVLRFFRSGSGGSVLLSSEKTQKTKHANGSVLEFLSLRPRLHGFILHFNHEASFWAKLFFQGRFRPMIQLPEGLLWDSQRPRARSPLAMVERYCWLARHEMCLGEQVANLLLGRRMSYS